MTIVDKSFAEFVEIVDVPVVDDCSVTITTDVGMGVQLIGLTYRGPPSMAYAANAGFNRRTLSQFPYESRFLRESDAVLCGYSDTTRIVAPILKLLEGV
jgi:hypothetical protein